MNVVREQVENEDFPEVEQTEGQPGVEPTGPEVAEAESPVDRVDPSDPESSATGSQPSDPDSDVVDPDHETDDEPAGVADDQTTGEAGEPTSKQTKGDEDGEESPLDTEAEIAADYLEELLDIVDLDGDIDTYLDGGRAHVSIVTESDVLVGANGQVLDALQELTRLAVMTETGDRSRLMLDVAGYRDQRRQELNSLAGDAVQEVKDHGEKIALAPMNPFERKIVHDAVAAAGLTSESEGQEPRRRVVVLPV